jgi:uncharacterized 2Fe-2S/4Fe-4S cluster protein (DUF4445 family)
VEPRFQEHFVEAMAFPHRTAPSKHLAKVTELPARPAPGRGPSRTERSARRRRAVGVAAEEER